MSEHKTKITINPQGQFLVSGGDQDSLKNKEAAVNVGCDLRVFLNADGHCGSIKGIMTAGRTAEPEEAYNQDAQPEVAYDANNTVDIESNTFELAGKINTQYHDEHHNAPNVALENILSTLVFKCGEHAEFEATGGFARNVQQDESGRYTCGWYKCQNEYFGNAFEGFVNPFIWNKTTKGMKLSFKQGGCEAFGHYGVRIADAARNTADQTNTPNVVNNASYGFFDMDTPSVCDLGVCYNAKLPCGPSRLSLVCQQINNGQKGYTTPDWGSRNSGNDGWGAMTTAASAALAQSGENDQYINALTAGMETKAQGIDLNAALTCANAKNTSDKSARILKWSLGCVSKCQPIKCLPMQGGMGAQAFGINIGTPAYLSEDLESTSAKTYHSSNQTLKKDETPLVCEASVLLNVCGFNLPIFVDYMNKHDGVLKANSERSVYNVEANKSSVLICGMRPSRINGLDCEGEHTKCFHKHILDCSVEGGLDEDEE